jgi:hypothetical protein
MMMAAMVHHHVESDFKADIFRRCGLVVGWSFGCLETGGWTDSK